jgi:rod shape-determining protein MreC
MANGSWRIARTRGGVRLPLVIVAVLAVALILIGKAQTSLFDRARANVSDWMSPILKTTAEPLDTFGRWWGSIGEIFTVYQRNLELKEQNAKLMRWQSKAVELDERLKRYKLLLNAVPDPVLSSKVARVIGRANHPFLQTMILDAGRQQGIKPGQAVIDARGMIGRIFLTGEHTAWVIPLTDLNSRIPVTILPGNAQAIMAGDNSRSPVIETLSQGVELKPGDEVLSSGDGDLLPPDLAIGVIVKYGHEYRVALFADQFSAQDVEIIDFKQPPEKLPAPGPGDLPVTAAGLPPAAPPPPPPTEQPALGATTVAKPVIHPAPVAAPKPPAGGAGNDENADTGAE